MAGILDFYNPQGTGGILSPQPQMAPWQQPVGLFGAALRDAGAYLSGHPADANSIQSYGQQINAYNARQQAQQAVQAAQSSDPGTRQQGYAAMVALGLDPSGIQKMQSQAALPQLLQNLQPSPGFNDNPVGVTPAVNAQGPGVDAARAAALQTNAGPAMSMQDATLPGALQRTGVPELTSELALPMIQAQMAAQLKGPDSTPHEGINPATGRPGQYLLKNGVPQWLDVGVAPKAPTTRNVRIGTTEVTQEFDPMTGSWKEVARGAAFKPEKPLEPPDPKAVDLGVQYFLQYGKLPPTARSPALQAGIMAAASDRLSAQGKTMEDVVHTAQTNQAAGQTVTAFDKGKQGDTVRSLNVSVQHLDTLRQLGQALKNGDINLINAARQKFSEAFGVAAPTNWDAAKAIVADEVAKGVIGGQTAQSDRETLAATLKNSRSPEQAEGAINTFQDLLGGQLRGLRQQYKSSTGRDDFNNKLFPETVNRLDPPKKAQAPGLPQILPQKPSGGWGKATVVNP